MTSANAVSGSGTLAAELAAFAMDTEWNDLPPKVQRESIRSFVNWVGCAVGGSRSATADTAIRGLLEMSGPGAVPILGRRERLNVGDAGLINCLASAADTFDDTHLSTITHPTGPVAAAVLAVAATRRVAGRDLLRTLTIGMEVECRLSVCITDPSSGANPGWYITGVSGSIGTAAAVSLLLGASHQQLAIALCLAATQASGLRASHGYMSVAFVPGIATRNGLASAYLAMAGFTSGDHVIEGRNGLLPVIASQARHLSVLEGLGSRFEMLGNAYKPYPCGIVIHPSIDACIDLFKRLPAGADIERVELVVHPGALALCWRKLPSTEPEAQVSLFHWVAAALVRGSAGLEEGNATAVADPLIRRIQTVTEVIEDAALEPDQAKAKVYLRDGTVLSSETLHATGSLANPMTDLALSEKFQMLARKRLRPERTEALMDACWKLAESHDASNISTLAIPD